MLNKGQQLLALTPEGPDGNTEQDVANLQDKWEAVQGKVTERKVRPLWWRRVLRINAEAEVPERERGHEP